MHVTNMSFFTCFSRSKDDVNYNWCDWSAAAGWASWWM